MIELESMYQIGISNGEDVRKINVSEIHRMEPNLTIDEVKAGLYSPNEYVVDPFLLPLSNLYTALEYECKLVTNCKVHKTERVSKEGLTFWNISTEIKSNKYQAATETLSFYAKMVINCAGNYSDETHRLLNKEGKDMFDITPAKGEYVVFTSLSPKHEYQLANGMVNCIPSKTFAGSYMFRSVYGNFVVGPTKITQESKTDRACKEERIELLKNYAEKHFSCLRQQDEKDCLLETYSGLRPQDLKNPDYNIIFDNNNTWATVGAIRSTGLTASRAIAQFVAQKMYPNYSDVSKLKDIEMPQPIMTEDGKWRIGEYIFSPTHPLSKLGGNGAPKLRRIIRSAL